MMHRPVAHIHHAGESRATGPPSRSPPAALSNSAVPFCRLGLKDGDPIRFYVELLGGDASLDRAPREGIFELVVPTPDFERIMWQV